MTCRYMALVKCQDIPRTQHKHTRNWVTQLSVWKFSSADGPTGDQEEETVEDLLSEQWYWKTSEMNSKEYLLVLKCLYFYLLNQLHLHRSKKYFSILMTVMTFQLPKWYITVVTQGPKWFFSLRFPYICKPIYMEILISPGTKNYGNYTKWPVHPFCCTVLVLKTESCADLSEQLELSVSAAKWGTRKGSVSRNSDPNLIASSHT